MSFRSIFKVASVGFEQRFARMVLAMSLAEAKAILGLPLTGELTPEEINKAYRKKAIENHPDRGGSHEKMVEVNVAKEVLEGKRSQTFKSRPYTRPNPPPTNQPPAPKVEVVKGKSFSDAVPSWVNAVDWKIVSNAVGWYYPASSSSGKATILLGLKGDQYLALCIVEESEKKVPHPQEPGVYQLFEATVRAEYVVISSPLPKTLLKKVTGAFKLLCSTVQEPKKFLVWDQGNLTEASIKKANQRKGVALKVALAQAGLITPEEGRKTQVMLDAEPRSGSDIWASHYQNYNIFVSINGGPRLQLADSTLLKRRGLFSSLFNNNFDKPVNLTKTRTSPFNRFKMGPGQSIQELADSLTSEPSSLVLALLQAAEEWEKDDEFKKAAAFDAMLGSSNLRLAAASYGCTPMEFLARLYA